MVEHNNNLAESKIGFAQIIRKRKIFRKSIVDFTTNIEGTYALESLNGFRLKKEDEYIYSEKPSHKYPFFKEKLTSQKHQMLKRFPFTITLPNYGEIKVNELKGKGLTSTWSIKLNNEELGTLTESICFIPWEEIYTIYIPMSQTEKVDLMLFILMMMFVKRTDNSGT